MSALRASCECCGGPALPDRLCADCERELAAERPVPLGDGGSDPNPSRSRPFRPSG